MVCYILSLLKNAIFTTGYDDVYLVEKKKKHFLDKGPTFKVKTAKLGYANSGSLF